LEKSLMRDCGSSFCPGHSSQAIVGTRKAVSRIWILLLMVSAFAVVCGAPAAAQVSVLTSRNDTGRTGQNIEESLLNSINVNSATFAKLGTYAVDGYVVAQPLYMPNLTIGGTSHNVVFIADQHDSIYAFDADNTGSGLPLWQVSFINPPDVTTVPVSAQGCAVVNGYAEIGIQGTPVIDPTTNTLYVDVKTQESPNGASPYSYHHRLHALDITSGQEKFGGPVEISFTGTLPGSKGTVTFNALHDCQRPGLLLSNGVVYLGFGSNGCDATQGWVFAYNATTLAQMGVFNTSPNLSKGANVWQGGAGLATNDDGSVFFITANGTFDANTGGADYGDTFMKLTLGSGLSLTDSFTPYDQQTMGANDLDLGSGGAMLLSPQQSGYSNNVAIGAGKTGTIYLINADGPMGGYNSTTNNVVQWLQDVLNEVDGTPAYWNGYVYFAPVHSAIVAYSINGLLSDTPMIQSQSFSAIGAPSISADGATNGLVWLVRQSGPTAAMLSAFDATKLTELYNTQQISSRDALGTVAHFATPTIANGKVFVGTQNQLLIYGLLPLLSPVSGGNQTGAAGTTLPVAITVQATNPYSGAAYAGVSVTFSDGGKGGTFAPPTATTNSSGQASTNYTLPKTFKTSSITITATSAGYASGKFVETIVAGAPTTFSLVSGGSQSGTVGTTLAAPIVLKLTDTYGNPVTGASVSFSQGTATGTFSSNPVTTDSLGRATVSYTLPTKAGTITITASDGSVMKSVQARAVAGNATSVSVAAGNNQSAQPNTLLAKSLIVGVKDQYGNPVAGVTVTFSDNGANGTFSNPTAISNASGQAAVQYTTPGQAGKVTIDGSVTGLNPAVFTVTVL
jgi:hypothetical protein